MRVARFVPSLSICFLLSVSLAGQQTATSSPQAQQLLQRSHGALAGGQALTDVTLSGTARRIAGSDDETGTAVLKATAAGATRIDLALPSGQRSEIQSSAGGMPVGAWAGPDRASHSISEHNLKTDPAWFFPPLTFARFSNPQSCIASYIGQETRNGESALHLTAWQKFPNLDPQGAAFSQRLSQTEIFLDPSTLLTVAATFNIHPDKNALMDIPVEIRFSDYRSVNGVQVPFHVQKYVNYSLILDLQFQQVVFNSGLSSTDFAIQ
jgi:hypothetical protein